MHSQLAVCNMPLSPYGLPLRLSAGLSRLSVLVASGVAIITIAAGSAVDALSIAAIGIVGTGSVNQRGCDCQPEGDKIFHMAPF